MNQMKRAVSLFLTIVMLLGCIPAVFAEEVAPGEINADTVWSYLDDGTDPAGDASAAGYQRTGWTTVGYDASSWKTAKGSFGAKNGNATGIGEAYPINTLLSQYKEDGTDKEAFFFRTTVNVEDADAVKQIIGSVIYDDSATVYINGKRIAGFDDESISANLQYGGSNAGDPKTGEIAVTQNVDQLLVDGENIVAVEIHQGRSSSSDIYFKMPSLQFSTEEPEPVVVDQTNITMSMGSDKSQMNFTWYANTEDVGTVVVAKASALVDGGMPADAQSFAATAVSTGKTGYYSNQTTVTGLEAGTTYAYQLVNGDAKSEIYTFETAADGEFSFAFAGDPQIGSGGSADASRWGSTLALLDTNETFADISFLLSAGDQVDTNNNETQYDGYLNHDAFKSLPQATTIGNHDSGNVAYNHHFNAANESSQYGVTAAGGDSYFVYNQVLFMILNTNDQSVAEHKQFMVDAIAATENQDIQWKIVTFHQSIYSAASHTRDENVVMFRANFPEIFKSLGIDVVLQGHDHVYDRTYMMDGNTPVTDSENYIYGNGTDKAPTAVYGQEDGILYVTANSASGSKFYTISGEYAWSAVQNQERIPNISKVTISDDAFTITTYRTTDMSVMDAFSIYRNAKPALKDLIDEVNGLDTPADTNAAWKQLQSAKNAAQAVYDNTESTDEQIQDAFDTLQSALSNYQVAERIARAVASAEAAQAAAEQAKADALTAQAAAETAKADAETAKADAEAAQKKAETAQAAADAAAKAAGENSEAAEAAKTAAETAKNLAVTAKENAETAKTAAEDAQAKAKTAADNAKTAEDNAKTAQTKAEEAAKAAEENKEEAAQAAVKAAEEAANAAAESGKATSEAAKAAESSSAAAASAAAAAKAAQESAGYASDAAESAKAAQLAQKAAEEERLAAEVARKAAEEAALNGAKYQAAVNLDTCAAQVDQSGYNREQVNALAAIVTKAKAAIADAASIEEVDKLLTAAKTEITGVKDLCASKAYTDVDGDAWYHEAVDYMVKNGYMNGVSDTEFDINGSVTRAQLVTILYRVAGKPSVDGMKNPFTDVAKDTWYTDAVIWAANEGVVKGMSETKFAPNQKITREQIVTILYRYDGEQAVDAKALAGYQDAGSVSDYAANAMNWAIANGIVNGVTATTLEPTATATRVQICAIMMRYLDK